MDTWAKVAIQGGAVTLLAATTLTGAGMTAQAGTPGCVSKKEFKRVNVASVDFRGMSMRKVHTMILNTDGTQIWLSPWLGSAPKQHKEQTRRYDVCGNGDGYVLMGYSAERGPEQWDVIGKWADWNG